MISRHFTRWAVPAVGAVAVSIAVGTAAADTPTSTPAAGAADAGTSRAVTLITGDTVHVTTVVGAQPEVTVEPALRPDGARPSFWVSQRGGDLMVIPRDVARLIPTHLDAQLFDVTSLLAQGDGDGASSSIPLIATYKGGGAPTALPGTRTTQVLRSVHGAALRAPKATTHRLGAALSALASPGVQTKLETPVRSVAKIWLDARVHVTADPNMTQIGAPEAWARGYDGSGVTVAVLDTGVDTTHPDLAGRVAASKNFAFTADALDHFGHGTHVASIIAGTGAASGGQHRGVADGAALLNGKVLNDTGTGFSSWVIAGMQWASTEQHANIVNLSLGFPPGSFDGGPVSQAVNDLTAANGTLFVVAAGNGACNTCIGSPADATSALTVEAVDSADQPASFDSAGPVPTNFRLKPDIAAPGVDIVAARAAGTSLGTPVDANYTTLSGTSMATPHIAGAAALLLQAHPDLTAAQLKAELMDSAHQTPDVSVYAQGAGRVDIPSALDDTLVADAGSLDFGFFSFPHDGRAPVERSLSYRNLDDHDVTVMLATDVRDADGAAAAGMLSVSPTELTIPAHGTASVTVALDTAVGGTGVFGGTVSATASDGATAHTVVGFDKEPPMYNLHVEGIARDGRAANGGFKVVDVQDGSVAAQRFWPGDPSAGCTTKTFAFSDCIRVPAGTYSVMGFVFTMPAYLPSTESGRTAQDTSLVGNPQLTVDHDMTITLDARTARPVQISTPGHPDARANMGGAFELQVSRTPAAGVPVTDEIVNYPGAQLDEQFYVQPTARVTMGDLSATTRWRLEAPDLTLGAPGLPLHPTYYDPVWFSDVSSQYPRFAGTGLLPVVDVGTATAAELSGRQLHGRLALVRRSDAISVAEQSNNAAAAGARIVAIYNDGPGDNPEPGGTGVKLQVPTVRLSHDEGVALLHRLDHSPVVVVAHGVPASPYLYDLVFTEHDQIPQQLRYVAAPRDLATVVRHFHGEVGRPMTYSDAAFAFLPGDTFSVSTVFPLIGGGPRERTDYYLADPDVRWNYAVQTPESPYNFLFPEQAARIELQSAHLTSFPEPVRVDADYFGAPIAPGLDPLQPLQRAGDVMRVHMAGFVDADGNFSDGYTSLFPSGFSTDFHMYADGVQVAATKFLAAGTIRVPATDAQYRIDYSVANAAPWAALSTQTNSSWTFESSEPASGEVRTEPLILADYDLDTDLQNVAPRGPIELGVTLAHQAGAVQPDITSASLDVSYDDGATWRPATLTADGAGRYLARLASPPGHGLGYVSLRLHAADAAGATLSQEVIRAFAAR